MKCAYYLRSEVDGSPLSRERFDDLSDALEYTKSKATQLTMTGYRFILELTDQWGRQRWELRSNGLLLSNEEWDDLQEGGE